MKDVLTKRDILELIKNRKINAKEGLEFLKKVTSEPTLNNDNFINNNSCQDNQHNFKTEEQHKKSDFFERTPSNNIKYDKSFSDAYNSPYQAVVIEHPGSISDVKIKNINPAEPADNEIQIMVRAFALNFRDILCIKGLYPATPKYPMTPGFEVSGIVIKKGSSVVRYDIGDEVIAIMVEQLGGHSTIVNVPEKLTVLKPENVSFEDACTFPIAFITMYHAFEKAQVQKGERILIQGATGGIGLIGVQLGLLKETEVYATAPSDEKVNYLKSIGVHFAINYKKEDYTKKILELTNYYGVDVIFNTLGGDSVQKGAHILAPEGRYIEIAMAGLKSANNMNLAHFIDNQTLYSIDLRKLLIRHYDNGAKYFGEYLAVMLDYMKRGIIKSTIGKIFPFSQIHNAYSYLENRNNIGKVVVSVPEFHVPMLNSIYKKKEAIQLKKDQSTFDIAVIGMSGRFPKAKNIDEYWENLVNGLCSIDTVPEDRWDLGEYYDPDPQQLDKTNCKYGGFLDDIYYFDPVFFNISGKEAKFSDPHQRLFLEESWKALEDAGYAIPDIAGKKCGVFVGVTAGDYLFKIDRENVEKEAQVFWGNESSVVPARISYFLDLKGPSIAINTACSSSLVASHLACQSILNGDSDMAIVGSVFLYTTPGFYILASNANLLSVEGRCKTFDDRADGMVPGEAVGAVVIKSLAKSLEDNDHIYGVIKGSMLNQDGKTYGITAPSTISQTQLLTSIYERYKINPETINYIEAHGTGTKLGDPIEIEALTSAFKKFTDKKGFCGIGSVKTNIGHTMNSSGIASLIKVLLCLKNKQIPKSLHYEIPNALIQFDGSPFYVNTELREWKASKDQPRRAAISAFGFSGTNAHMIIDEPPVLEKKHNLIRKPFYLIAISAKSDTALNRKITDLLNWLEKEGSEHSIGDIAYTLLVARSHFSIRISFVTRDIHDLNNKLKNIMNNKADNYYINDMRQTAFKSDSGIMKSGNNAIQNLSATSYIPEHEYHDELLKIAELYAKGYNLDWEKLFPKKNYYRISLPTYPFDRHFYSINEPGKAFSSIKQKIETKDLSKKESISNEKMNVEISTKEAAHENIIVNQREKQSSPNTATEELISLSSIRLNGKKDNKYTKTEILIAEIWGKELGFNEINIYDSLFDLGLDSIYAAKIANRLSNFIKMQININDILTYTNIYEFAHYLDENASLKQEDGKEFFSAILPAAKSEKYPVSPAQKRLFILDQLDKSSINYNIPFSVRFEGILDREKLENIFQKLLNRHESFKTTFHFIDGELFQRIHENIKFELEHQNADEAEIDKIVNDFIKPFDLGKLPLIRIKAISFSSENHLLLFDMHHIISDATSLVIFLKEFSAINANIQLPDFKIQYKDFALWQNDLLKSDLIKKQKDYWIKRFSDTLPVLNMPLDFPRPMVQTFEGDRYYFRTDKKLKEDLLHYSKETASTLYIVLLAAYNILLYKYTGQEDIIVGSPITGRIHSDVENIVGMFVNTLAMRNFPSTEKSINDFLMEVKANALDAYENQACQFEDLVEHLNITRAVNRNPLFDTMFILQNSYVRGMNSQGFKISSFKNESKKSKFDLTLETFEKDEELEFNFEYCTKLFKKETIEKLSQHYINILKEIVAKKASIIGDIDILFQEEKNHLLIDFNRTETEYQREMTIPLLFEKHAEQTPDATALIFNNKKMTYREFNEAANQLANYLIKEQNVKPDTLVGILMYRSFDFMVAIMGILKAGGAYIPMDPQYPEKRINDIISDSKVSMVLSQKQHIKTLNNLQRECDSFNTYLCMDSEDIHSEDEYKSDTLMDSIKHKQQLDMRSLRKHSREKSPSSFNPNSLAYVIYTSGSTGKPKGVMIEHTSVVNILANLETLYPMGKDDAYLLKTNYTFDVSVTELFGWFFGNGTLVILDPHKEKEPAVMVEFIKKYNITHINFVPSMLNVFMDVLTEKEIEDIKCLKYVFVAGEKYSEHLAEKTAHMGIPAKFENIYGPTEFTIYVTKYSMHEYSGSGPVPIGKPLNNIKAYIVDKSNNLVPVGVPGELCFGGTGIARGYVNRPELTNEKFVQNPFKPNEKIYRTGDLAYWLPDGNIVYMGRIDHQVKIRGFRIEIGEIEQVMLKHPVISEVVILDKDDNYGNKNLFAYFTSKGDITMTDLREYLLQHLPEYMVPAQFVPVDRMPLNPNGKIDRKVLESIETKIVTESEYIAPTNDIEQALAKIWKELLGIERISVNDNFFELGGNSIKAIQAVYKLQKEYTISINDIFMYPVISKLAKKLSTSENRVMEIAEIKKIYNDTAEKYEQIHKSLKGDYDKYLAKIESDYSVHDLSKQKSGLHILLTGGTGYLGAHLIHELFKNSDAHIYTLNRGNSPEHAKERLNSKLEFYFNKNFYKKYKSRLHVIQGDVTKDNLALSSSDLDDLFRRINCIINCAANVKHYGEYEEFYQPNVAAVANLLNISEKRGIKDFYQISTSGVAFGKINSVENTLYTEYDYNLGQNIDNYYLKTKFEAEQMLIAARERGMNTNILRAGNLVSNSDTGKFQQNIEDNGFYKLITGYIRLKKLPKMMLQLLEFSYIDYASRAMALLLLNRGLSNEIYHIYNPNKISYYEFSEMLTSLHYDLNVVPMNDFIDYLFNNYENPDLKQDIQNIILHSYMLENIGKTNFVLACDKTTFILKKLGFQWPSVTKEHIRKMLDYCREVNFL